MQPSGEPIPDFSVVDPTLEPTWDRALLHHPGATIFHSAGWAEVLKKTYGFRAHYVACKRGGALVGLLALMEARGLLGQRRGIALPFTDSCPLLMPPEEPTPPLSEACVEVPAPASTVGSRLLQGARQIADQRRWHQIEFRPSARPIPESSASVRFLSHELPLLGSDLDQRNQCLPATRRTLRQAQAGTLRVTVGTDVSLVRAYYGLHCQTRRRQGGPPQPYPFFLGLQQCLLGRDLGFVVLATESGSPVAGAVFLRFGQRAVYKFGASIEARRHLRPNQLVMWSGIRHAASLGCTTLDLGRTSVGNDGLRQFKRGWGAAESHLAYHCFDLDDRREVVLNDRTHGWQTHWFRRLPVWIGRMIGTIGYRFAA